MMSFPMLRLSTVRSRGWVLERAVKWVSAIEMPTENEEEEQSRRFVTELLEVRE